MRLNHNPCPVCGGKMHRQSKRCHTCYAIQQSSPEARAALSEKRKGQPTYRRTAEHRGRMSKALMGKPRPWLQGRKRPEVAQKIAAAWTPEMREAARQRGLLAAENRQWLLKIAEALAGENNPNYQGKDQASPYALGWGRGYKDKIRQRADGVCQMCGKRPDYTLDLHHKDFGKDNHAPDNLMVICRSCHKSLHFANSART